MAESQEFMFPPIGAAPGYPDVTTYGFIWGEMRVWEGDGWQDESMSWKEGAYVAANLTGPIEIVMSGPGAQDFLSRISINNVYNWPVGRSKHLVMLTEDGLIANHALAVRDAEDRFRTLASPPWPRIQQDKFDFDVHVDTNKIFILQVAGPTSLQILERLLGHDLRDVGFLDVVPARIPGIDADVELELSRIGMVGTLAYEIRGPLDAGPAVYDAVYKAGQGLGIKRLGWRTYTVNHTEGGFPQLNVSFLPSMLLDPAVQQGPLAAILKARVTGSIDPADMRARMRTPQEVNWAWMGKFDHDFVGREAMEAEAADPKRKTVILKWNADDIKDIYASMFEPGEPYKFIEFPVSPQQPAGGHADLVTIDGKPIGVSSHSVYSFYYREMISQATIDLEHAEIGTEVVLHWGDFGKRIKEVRATVERFPYLELPSNKDYDLTSVPSGL